MAKGSRHRPGPLPANPTGRSRSSGVGRSSGGTRKSEGSRSSGESTAGRSGGRKVYFRNLGIHHFFLISLLIFLLPIAREWRTIAFGDRVTGTVIENRKITKAERALIGGVEFRAMIAYTHQNKEMLMAGPENLQYDVGRQLPLIIHPDKPEKIIIANFAGFYLQKRSIAVIIVFILWLAIYSTLVQGRTSRSRKQ